MAGFVKRTALGQAKKLLVTAAPIRGQCRNVDPTHYPQRMYGSATRTG